MIKKLLQITCLLTSGWAADAQHKVIMGKVTSGREPVEYATVSVCGSGNLGATSAKSGHYRLSGDLGDTCTLTTTAIGYKSVRVSLNFRDTVAVVDFDMPRDISTLNEFVVSGVSKATLLKENPVVVVAVSGQQIDGSAENNVIDAIAKNAPGFDAVKTGPNVSKPFINGLGYNRVLTLFDGMRVETQQWGDEHGVPLDDYVVGKAEVIEGPASLMYGSDAIAGVLSLFSKTPQDVDGVLHGRYLSEYQSNNGMIGNALSLGQNTGRFSWAVRGSGRVAKNYSNPVDGSVYNTAFRMANASAYLGYQSTRGSSHLNFTLYDNRQGIPDGSRDSVSRRFTYQIYESEGENVLQTQVDDVKNRPLVPEAVLNSYAMSPLAQRIQDYRLYSDHDYSIGCGQLVTLLGFEQNVRREYDHPTDPVQAGEFIVLNTLDYGVRYNLPTVLGIEPAFGVNGMYQNNTNRNATDFPIPDYRLFDVGSFAFGKWKHGRWTLAGGLRYDHRSEQGDAMFIKPNPATGFFRQVGIGDSTGATKQFPEFQLQFQGVTGSFGATWNAGEHIGLKANIARGYRAPNITEIASNGLDPGAHIVYEGNLAFEPEFSLQEDVALTATYPDFSLGCNVFCNSIQNYIYEDQKVDAAGNPVVVVPGNRTFQFQQTDARLYGANATFDIRPRRFDKWTIRNALSAVYGYNLNPKYRNAGNNGEYLPFIPPPHWLCEFGRTLIRNYKRVKDMSIRCDGNFNAAQNRYLGLYATETRTAAYTLFDVALHADIRYGSLQVLQLQLSANNVFNAAYQSHLSRLQYFEYYSASPNGRLGIYDMGRNICFKVIVPF